MGEIDFNKDRRVVSGPYHLYDGSMIIEFLEADDFDATFFVRVTLPAKHPLLAPGVKHPISPPLHVHFDQCESFKVLKGRWGFTTGWEQKDQILTPDDEPFVVTPMLPHSPWPVPCGEESVVLAWGHPSGTPKPLDKGFFEQIFLYTHDLFESKKSPDLLQLMLMQHETNSTGVMLPSWTFLGSLRWWIPWHLQGTMAALARVLGYSKDMPQYTKQQ